jgi:hypothetical protein
MTDTWYEVWADDALEPPYLLLVLPSGDRIIVQDPHEHNRVVFTATSYEEVRYWLLEDEYTRVTGRMTGE